MRIRHGIPSKQSPLCNANRAASRHRLNDIFTLRTDRSIKAAVWVDPGKQPHSRHSDDMADPEAIYHWRRLDDRVTTSGQPTESQLADIHALGVRHIVNLGLHTHEKALPDEAASVSRLGMTYIHIPVDFQNPTDRDFEQFCAVMEQLKELPVHVHCIANYRVSAFFYRYHRDVLGMNEAEARAEMEEIWHPEGVWAAFVGR